MQKFVALFLLLLLLSACKKESSTDFTRDYPGQYAVYGKKQSFFADSISVVNILDTVSVTKVDFHTLSFNGLEFDYAEAPGGSRWERREATTMSVISFNDALPDSIYYLVSHIDGLGGGYSINLRGRRI